MNTKIDWLGFTFPLNENEVELTQIWDETQKRYFYFSNALVLFFNAFPEFDNIAYSMEIRRRVSHYTDTVSFMDIDSENYIDVFYDRNKINKGVNVQCPSSTLPYLLKLFNSDSIWDVMQIIHNRGCKFSRIDICYDDFDKVYRPWHWYLNLHMDRNGNFDPNVKSFVSCARTISPPVEGSDKSTTLYIGTRSRKILRIYDKYLESKGKIDSVRYEFELHNDHAERLYLTLLDHAGSINFWDYFVNFIDYVSYRNHNASNYKRAAWFQSWLEKVNFSEKLVITKLPVVQDQDIKIRVIVEDRYSELFFKYAYSWGIQHLLHKWEFFSHNKKTINYINKYKCNYLNFNTNDCSFVCEV